MKKLLLSVAFITCLGHNAFAQKNPIEPIKTEIFSNAKANVKTQKFGSFSVLKGMKAVNCSYSFEDATVKRTPISVYKDDFYEENIDATVKDIHEAFFREANIRLSRHKAPILSNYEPTKYAIKMYVTKASENGGHTVYALLIDNETGEVSCQRKYRVLKGGTFGSMVHLFREALPVIARKLAKDISHDIK